MNNHDYTHSIARFIGWIAGVVLIVLMLVNLLDRPAHAYTDAETGVVVVLADTIATPNVAQAIFLWEAAAPSDKAKLRLVVASSIASGYFVKLGIIAMRVSNHTGVDTPEEELLYENAGRYLMSCPIFTQPLDDFIEDVLRAGKQEAPDDQMLSFSAFVIEHASVICAIANSKPSSSGDTV